MRHDKRRYKRCNRIEIMFGRLKDWRRIATRYDRCADKAYDADRLRNWLVEREIKPVIPGRAARNVVKPLNRRAYSRRNIIERMLGRLKNWKRIATRYDCLAVNYIAAIALIATVTQWRG